MREKEPRQENIVSLENVPEALQPFNQWVAWDYTFVDGKARKPPFNPVTGHLASPTDLTTWGSFEQAQEVVKTGRYQGLGFVFSQEDPFTGIDLDHALDKEGNLEAWTLPILATLDSYTEISPSGTGLHILVRAAIPHGRKRNNIEMYARDRYFTVTGNHLPQSPATIEDRQGAMNMLHELLTPPTKPQEHIVYETSRDDDTVLKKAMDEHKDEVFIRLFGGDASGYASKSNADFTFILKLLYWTNGSVDQTRRLFLKSGLVDEKTLSLRGSSTYLDVSIENAIKRRSR